MDIPLIGLVPAPGEASIPNAGGTTPGLPNTPVHVAKQISVALIDDGNVQLDQLSRELSTGLESLSMVRISSLLLITSLTSNHMYFRQPCAPVHLHEKIVLHLGFLLFSHLSTLLLFVL